MSVPTARKPLDGYAIWVMVALCLCWGLQQVTIKASAHQMNPVLQVGIRSFLAAVMVAGLMLVRGESLSLRDGTNGPVTVIHCSPSGTNSSITCMVAKSVTTKVERDSTSLVFHGVTAYGPNIVGGNYTDDNNVSKTEALQLSLQLPNEALIQANGEILKVNTFAKRIGTILERRTE